MKKMSFVLGVCIFCALPLASQAYFTTNQTAVKLNDHAAMYLIEYAFGHEDFDIYMPVTAQRDLARESDEKKVGYAFIKNEDQVQENGTSAGLVVSTAPIVDGMYKLEKGTSTTMTLLAFLITNEEAEESDYALQVSKLPYYIDRGDGAFQALQLNPSELQYYVTKEVELNTKTD